MNSLVEKIKGIILDNNYFNTLPGERFVEWNNVKDIVAVIAFSGRSKKQESYMIDTSSDSDTMYVTHLYIDCFGNVLVQLSQDDDDDFEHILHHNGIPIEKFGNDILKEWIELLNL